MIIERERSHATTRIFSVDGTALVVRPIELTDVERLERMFTRLSPESVYNRFFSPIRRLPRAALLHLSDVDGCTRDALVAVDGDDIVAVARYDGLAAAGPTGGREAEIAITVLDEWQGRGLGRRLGRRLGLIARRRGYDAFVARVLPHNRAALRLVRKLAPDATVRFDGGDYEARLPLTCW